jgi:hypothetical protein
MRIGKRESSTRGGGGERELEWRESVVFRILFYYLGIPTSIYVPRFIIWSWSQKLKITGDAELGIG